MVAILGNVIWFILGGFFAWLSWVLLGLLLCITVIGIPFGIAAFRIARVAAFPFGCEIVDARLLGEERIVGTGFANVLWIVLAGLWLAILHALAAVSCFLAFFLVFPIFFGLAHLKLVEVCFAPLGRRVVNAEEAKRLRAAPAITRSSSN